VRGKDWGHRLTAAPLAKAANEQTKRYETKRSEPNPTEPSRSKATSAAGIRINEYASICSLYTVELL